MPRDRSRERSPRDMRGDRSYRRDEDRDRDRDRERGREKYRAKDRPTRDDDGRTDRYRDGRGREKRQEEDRPYRKRDRSRDHSAAQLDPTQEPETGADATEQAGAAQEQALNLDADITPEEMQMMQAMGIPFGFQTTQGQHVEDDKSNAGGVKVKQTRRARQYMNRRGGFNRALPSERSGQTALRD